MNMWLIIGAIIVLLIVPIIWWLFEKKAILLKPEDLDEAIRKLLK